MKRLNTDIEMKRLNIDIELKQLNIDIEMKRLNIDILGMRESKWKEEGDFWSDNFRVIYSGYKNRNTGDGIILTKELGQRLKNYLLYNNRIMFIKLKQTKVTWSLYRHTCYKDEEIEDVCEQLEEVMDTVKKNDNLIILGEWNAGVGEGQAGYAV